MLTDQDHRRAIVCRFVVSAMKGDLPTFLANLPALNWPGAFRDAFAELVPLGWVHPDIRVAFPMAWRGQNDGARALGLGWRIGLDLQNYPSLYARGLRLLTLPYTGENPPTVLYRGQSFAEHHQGRHGVWWTPYPHIAEWFARSEIRDHTGPRCILAIFDPKPAIFTRLCDEEFLIDPAKLDHVELVATPAPYTAEQEHQDLNLTTILDRVPHGYAPEAVQEFRERVTQRQATQEAQATQVREAA